MAVKAFCFPSGDVGTAGTVLKLHLCDTQSELPASGVNSGDMAACLDTGTTYIFFGAAWRRMEDATQRGVANGLATLDAGVKVPTAQLGGAGADSSKFLRGDQSWVAVSGGGTPSDTVVSETSFGAAAAAGSASAYARGDHTHGTPTDPVLAHVAAGDPHTQYALESALAAVATSGSASDLGTGTLPIARVADGAVTYAKIQNVSATDKLLGRATAGAGVVEEITCTAAGRALIDDANAAAQRTTLGLVAVAASGSAADLGSGILPDARMPDLTGDVTTTEGAVATTIAAGAVTDSKVAAANKDGAAGTASMRTLGTGAAQACAGNDSRLSDARTPTDTSVSAAKLAAVMRIGLARINDYRLTGVSATPVMTADSTTLSTIYMTPFKGSSIALYDGTNWNLYQPGEISLAVTGRTTDLPFDVFAFDNAGTVTLEFLDWTNATTRATALARQNGVWCKSGALTRRYLGTCRARSATTYHWVTAGDDAPCKLDLWNADNRVAIGFRLRALTNTWTYTTATWRQAQGSANYQVDIMAGLQEEYFKADLIASSRNSTISIPRQVGIGFDSTTAFTGTTAATANTVASIEACQMAAIAHQPTIGRHFYAWLEISTATGACTWVGDDGALRLQSGMTGLWAC